MTVRGSVLSEAPLAFLSFPHGQGPFHSIGALSVPEALVAHTHWVSALWAVMRSHSRQGRVSPPFRAPTLLVRRGDVGTLHASQSDRCAHPSPPPPRDFWEVKSTSASCRVQSVLVFTCPRPPGPQDTANSSVSAARPCAHICLTSEASSPTCSGLNRAPDLLSF